MLATLYTTLRLMLTHVAQRLLRKCFANPAGPLGEKFVGKKAFLGDFCRSPLGDLTRSPEFFGKGFAHLRRESEQKVGRVIVIRVAGAQTLVNIERSSDLTTL